MTRNIKFRAWHKSEKKMYQVVDMYFGKSGDLQSVRLLESHNGMQYPTDNIAIKDVELMQYTGLKDKNGIEIYEGYVVSFMFLKTKVECKRGVVVFDADELCYFIRTSSEWGYNHNLAWYDTKIIGNIYENPELLEVSDVNGR